MRIVHVDPQTDPLWQQLATTHPMAGIFQAPPWIRGIVQTYGFEPGAYVALDDDGKPVAGIPYCKISDMFGDRIASLPFSDFCDPLVSTPEQWQTLSAELLKHELPIAMRCLHNDVPLNDPQFPLGKQAKWHGVDITPDLDTLWEGFNRSARKAINKATAQGVTMRVGDSKKELRAFFELWFKIRKNKYHLLAQPYAYMENIWNNLIEPGNGIILTAIHNNEIIAAMVFLEWNNQLFCKFSAASYEHVELRPNELLFWEGIQHGKKKGITYVDFGLSDWDQEGLLQYKRKFATHEKTISFLQHNIDGIPTEQTKKARSLLPQLTDLFTDATVSDAVTEKAGEALYRFFT